MRKIVFLINLLLFVTLVSCEAEKTIECKGNGYTWTVVYNGEEVIRAYTDQYENTEEEMTELNGYIVEIIEQGTAENIEDFLLNHYAKTLEDEGAVCTEK